MTGNQHYSRKRALLLMLKYARAMLTLGGPSSIAGARWYLMRYRAEYALAPASTRRRWKAGR